jgi:hypothetical protein
MVTKHEGASEGIDGPPDALVLAANSKVHLLNRLDAVICAWVAAYRNLAEIVFAMTIYPLVGPSLLWPVVS